MNIRTSNILLTTATAGLLAGCHTPGKITMKDDISKSMSSKPNILFIMTDQQRFDALGCMGNKVLKTPNLDMLASQGVIFDAAYTPCPVCAPARAAIFSGQYPNGCGVNGNWVPFNGHEILITDQLKANGYTTGGVGKLHFVPHVKSFGFDFKELHDAPYSVYADDDKYSAYIKMLAKKYGREKADEFVRMFDVDESSYHTNLKQFILGRNFIPEKDHMVTWTVEQSVRFLKERDRSKPFFLYTGFFGPHHPWLAPERWNNMYKPEDIDIPELEALLADKTVLKALRGKAIDANRKLFTKDDYKQIVASYYGQVSMIDHYLGKLFDELKQQGLWDNTIIVFTADHGDHNGHFGMFFKCTMLESSARVPLIIKPAGKSHMKRVEVPVSTVDLYGTILDAAGVRHWKYAQIEAGSINSLLKSDDSSDVSPCYSILGRQSMLRSGHYKLVRLEQKDGPVLYELYFLKDNLLDGKNIYGSPELKDIQDMMKKQLDSWAEAQKHPEKIKWRK